MFDLKRAVSDWVDELRRGPDCGADDVAELESHLHEEIDSLQGKGLSEEEAFLIASRRIGPPTQLRDEYAKVNHRTILWKMAFRLALILSYWVLLFYAALGTRLASFIDSPSLLIVILGTFGVLLLNFNLGGTDLQLVYRTLWGSPMSPDERHRAVLLWRAAKCAALGVGTLAFLIAFMRILTNLSDPNAYGPFGAIAMLPVFYALAFVVMIALPCECIVRWGGISEEE